ncbi:hypothetical protein CXG81DRAFT_18606 [Caulochytrium protostelioides]|uniref:Uncharacterized protein n=1 Tax=Caulochytrium protostelioides TaxID=1555241 RepID=A0A4P9WZZ4_9FUNG|nr:hypothetical protein CAUPRSCDRAFT_10431 [Caulochytrium protostelioides]RKP01607.1 hypothetical protein CXG81DRAFT_18606 [Caulochytrium protostelioides]|eukprot:RKP01607.1 hypothetical protein CXG81DRAFT_18606 [Caulochytrium protostelioides]
MPVPSNDAAAQQLLNQFLQKATGSVAAPPSAPASASALGAARPSKTQAKASKAKAKASQRKAAAGDLAAAEALPAVGGADDARSRSSDAVVFRRRLQTGKIAVQERLTEMTRLQASLAYYRRPLVGATERKLRTLAEHRLSKENKRRNRLRSA